MPRTDDVILYLAETHPEGGGIRSYVEVGRIGAGVLGLGSFHFEPIPLDHRDFFIRSVESGPKIALVPEGLHHDDRVMEARWKDEDGNWQRFGMVAPYASRAILLERIRQENIGHDQTHDLGHKPGDLLKAAFCYLNLAHRQMTDKAVYHNVEQVPLEWPFEDGWKPGPDNWKLLLKAAALIAAEMDRMTEAKRMEEEARTVEVNLKALMTLVDNVRPTAPQSVREAAEVVRARLFLVDQVKT